MPIPNSADLIAQRLFGGRCVLLVGDAGVGKSHIASEVAQRLVEQGWSSEHIIGSASIRTVRFGAVAHLIGQAESRSPDELVAMAEGHLQRLGGDQPTVAIIDDLDRVDHGSLALIHRLAATGTSIIATVRTEGASDEGVLPFWKDGLLERHDVNADPAHTGHLAEAFLEQPATTEVVEALTTLTLGNPLFIRELIADGKATGSLVERDGEIALAGPLTAALRVADIVADRFASLSGPLLEALELVSIAGPLALDATSAALDTAIIEELEASGLIAVARVGADDVVSMAHPLLGDVVLSSLTTMRERRLTAAVSTAILSVETPRSVDLVRAVVWTIENGETPPRSAALAAARHGLAMFDGTTARLAIESVDATDDADSATLVMLGRALLLEGNPAAALRSLEAAEAIAASDADRAAAAATHGEALLFALGEMERAGEVLNRALAEVHDVHARAHLISMIVVAAGISGDWSPALELGRPIALDPELDEGARLSMLVMTTIAQAMSGQMDDLPNDLRHAIDLAERHAASHPAALDQLLVTRGAANMTNGELGLGMASLSDRLAHVGPNAAMSPMLQISVAQLTLLSGDIERSVSMANQATAPRASDPLGLTPLVHAIAACAHAMSGDIARSQYHHDSALGDHRSGPREQSFLGRAAAHRFVRVGDIDAAISECERATNQSGDNHAFTMPLIHDMVRFGRPDSATLLFDERDQFRSTGLFGVFATHAEALAASETVMLRKVSDEFFKTGALLYAAEASAQAARCAQDEGDRDAANRDITRAWELFGRCTSVWSVAMDAVPPALSSRENEVARLAGRGASTGDIAGQLFVSHRTVDNHLQKTYKKLGINTRAGLAPLFA